MAEGTGASEGGVGVLGTRVGCGRRAWPALAGFFELNGHSFMRLGPRGSEWRCRSSLGDRRWGGGEWGGRPKTRRIPGAGQGIRWYLAGVRRVRLLQTGRLLQTAGG